MSNMSYCRFRNTARDLADCIRFIDAPDGRISSDEREAAVWLIQQAQKLVELVADEMDVDADSLKERHIVEFVKQTSETGGRYEDDTGPDAA
jgi:hypothetical protein